MLETKISNPEDPIESRSEKNHVPAISLRARRKDRDETRMKWG